MNKSSKVFTEGALRPRENLNKSFQAKDGN